MRLTTSSSARRLVAAVVAAVAISVGATGCGVGMKDLPLPGTGVSGDTITVTAEFEEALNLAEGGLVRINGVDSGKVQEVTTEDFRATVEMKLQSDARIRQGANARLRYSTPLGELFIDITNPTEGQLLADGARLTTEFTDTAPTVEDALSQASLLINGGGLGNLQVVTEELNTIFNGREGEVKSLLRNSNAFMTEVNSTTTEIDTALRSLSSVSKTLDTRKETIHRALREIAPAARVLRQNTPGLTRLLSEVEKFARVANQTVGATRTELLTLIRQAGPVLREFSSLGSSYGVSLTSLVRLGKTIDNIVPSDYVALMLIAHLDQLSADDLNDLDELLGGILDLPLLGRTSQRDADGQGRPPALDDRLDDLDLGALLGDRDRRKPAEPGGILNLLGGL